MSKKEYPKKSTPKFTEEQIYNHMKWDVAHNQLSELHKPLFEELSERFKEPKLKHLIKNPSVKTIKKSKSYSKYLSDEERREALEDLL